jgi:co-chaperonin GroES (HSP10)
MPAAALKQRTSAEYDPKREILEKLGDISSVEIAQNEVLIAIYMRPEKTAGGIVVPGSNLKEDRYQGKAGLVIKIGSACRFRRTDAHTGVSYGLDIGLYDWVVVRPSDTWTLDLNADKKALSLLDFVACRLVYDDQIRMRVPSPEMVY